MNIKYKSRITWDDRNNIFRFDPTDGREPFDLEFLVRFTADALDYYPELKDVVINNECYIIQTQWTSAIFLDSWNDELNEEFDKIINYMDDRGWTVKPPSDMIAYDVDVFDGFADSVIFDKRFEELIGRDL